jgi:hypothetical protein
VDPENNTSTEDEVGNRGLSVQEARDVTRATASDFRDLLGRYIRRHRPTSPAPVVTTAEPPRLAGSHAAIIPLLQVIPWSLGIMFVASFLWDFPGMTVTLPWVSYPLDGLMRIVAVSGLIGFLTNWVAITMLFNPRSARPIFGQGLIPAQRERVIYRLATAVSEELINEEIIKQKIEENQIIPKYREMALGVTRSVIEDEEFRTELKALTSSYMTAVLTSEEVRNRVVAFAIDKIESWVGQGVGGFALKAYRFINEEDFTRRVETAIEGLPAQLDVVLDEMDALLDRIPEKIESRAEDIEAWATKVVLGFVENLDVYGMVMENMMAYDEHRLEDLIKRSTNEQLNYIKYLGGALGALGGFVIWQPVPALMAFVVLGGGLYAADEVIFRLRKAAA